MDRLAVVIRLRGLPVEILGRVLRRATPARVHNTEGGRPAKHGGEFVVSDPAIWDTEQAVTVTETRLYGQARAQAWDRLHPRLTRRAAGVGHDELLPIIEGTIIRLTVDHLPSRGEPSRCGYGGPRSMAVQGRWRRSGSRRPGYGEGLGT